ncbi:Gfo/Idh/MocA family protein [Paenibacillus spongiae]|uniref:Gfo/Idh/MocA family oxidoreductase n=1 Tax=Paenibacillus spongiae TaxID=2909671 RepID=A0ABY5S948_9BACL|nr:Gfo/Idh/MocA family oxidoreductase [Paenibacillus spongiae]UVI28828.1 Gfo/Idh/MocA family oxidoreductase [Paenibacillus spongiae]
MREINIGVIGLGEMARHHIRQLLLVPGVRIAAVCDIHSKAVQEVGDQLGIPASKRYEAYESLIGDTQIDGVLSVTPNDKHAMIIEACIHAGKPLFTEKPLTRTYEEAVRVLELYRRKKPIPCMVNFLWRNTPAFQYTKKMIQEGRIGRINHFFVQYLQGWGSSGYHTPFIWRFDEKITGTGTLGDLGSHMIDLAQYMIEDDITDIQAMLTTIVPERLDPETGALKQVTVDDFACFNARFTQGAVGVFQTSRNAIGADNQHEISLYGEEGSLHVSPANNQVVWHRLKEGGEETVTETIEVPAEEGLNPWQTFADLIRGDAAANYATLEDGFTNQLHMEAIVRSARNRSMIEVASLESYK